MTAPATTVDAALHPSPSETPRPDLGRPQSTVEIGDVSFVLHTIRVESSEGVAVAAADFDGDGHADLVVSGDPELTLLRGDGHGRLVTSRRVPGGEQPVYFALADLDRDGDVDIVVANHDTNYLTILLGDGQGAFRPAPDSPLPIEVSPHPHAVRVADFDLDGQVDLMVDHRDAHGFLLLRGLAGGGFETPGTLLDVAGDPYLGVALGDIDRDGMLDVVTPNPREVAVLLNRSRGSIAFEMASPVPAEAPFAVELGDFNGDDSLDLIAASDEGSSLVEVFLGNGTGGFDEAGDSPFHFAAGGKTIAVGDFNGDGIEDAAVACWQSSDVLVLIGGRNGIRTTTVPGGEHPWGLAAADLNEDGKDDLIIADDGEARLTLYLSIDP